MNKINRILSVNKYYWRKGGSESVFFNEKEMLERNGVKVIPFSMQSNKNEVTEYSRYFVDEVDYTATGFVNKIKLASKIVYSFDAKNKMSQLLNNEKVDLSHFHIFQHQISPSVFGPLRNRKIPIILTLHDLKPVCPNYKYYVNGNVCEACTGGKFINCFKNKCTKGSTLGSMVNTVEMYFHRMMGYYENVDRYIAVSKFYKHKMIESGFSENKIDYLPNYIDAKEYTANGEDKRYILYFGRLSEEKGISTFINSAEVNSDIPYYIVGTGPMEEELKTAVKNKQLSNVEFLGFKTGNELKTLLSECTCVVVPSEWYENCPMTILEAFASAKPVIGSNIGGIPELIDDGVDGFVFEPGNVQALSKQIKLLWQDPLTTKAMGKKGLDKVVRDFNAEKHYQGLTNIYKDVLDNK